MSERKKSSTRCRRVGHRRNTSKGRTLNLSWMSFRRVSDGAPALIDWLGDKGYTDLKYDIRSGTAIDVDEEERSASVVFPK